jgi:hypothetical protein
LKKVADGKLGTVESFPKTGQSMAHKASYIDEAGERHSVFVKADGTEIKN